MGKLEMSTLNQGDSGYVQNNEGVSEKEFSPEAKEVVEKMRLHKYYEEDFLILTPGEKPSKEFSTRLINTILMSDEHVLPLDYAQILMENLDFDNDKVRESAIYKIINQHKIDKKSIAALNVVGVDIDSLHEVALKELPELIWAFKDQTKSKKYLEEWKRIFKVTDDEYNVAAAESKKRELDKKTSYNYSR